MCHSECIDGCLQCDFCSLWTHYQCLNLVESEISVLESNSSIKYACSSCLNSSYFLQCLETIERALPTENQMKTGAEIQTISRIFEKFVLNYEPEFTKSKTKVDSNASQVLCHYKTQGLEPLQTTGDGNCFYNSISLGLFGSEEHSIFLRLKIVFYMILNYSTIDTPISFRPFSHSKFESVVSACKINEWANESIFYFASFALNICIHSIYPPHNGLLDLAHIEMNRPFNSESSRKIYIMWCGYKSKNLWVPNHFIALLPLQNSTPTIDISPPLSPVCLNASPPSPLVSPCMSPKKSLRQDMFKISSSDFSDDIVFEHQPEFDPLAADIEIKSYPNDNLDFSCKHGSLDSNASNTCSFSNIDLSDEWEKRIESNPSDICKNNIASSDGIAPPVDSVMLDEVKGSDDCHAFSFSNNGSFTNIADLMVVLVQSKNPISCVPNGLKENISFVIEDKKNLTLAKQKKHRNFRDDCGAWAEGNTKKIYFVCDNEIFVRLYYLKGKFFSEKSHKTEVNPDKNYLYKAHCYSASLKRQPSFKKRVVLIEDCPDSCDINLALYCVEYIGKFPIHTSPHSNSLNFTTEYVRSACGTLEKVKEAAKTLKPKQAYVELTNENVNVRNPQQIHNARKNGPSHILGNRSNLADDMQIVTSKIMEGKLPFVRHYSLESERNPNFICYHKEQLDVMKKILECSNGELIVGVDRTFNLSAVYVTLTVFKIRFLVGQKTRDCPIIFGPLFLHWDGHFETYFDFFSHLSKKLSDFNKFSLFGEKLKIGSDEEFALTKAISSTFPDSKTILCTKHLKDTLKRNAKDRFKLDNKIIYSLQKEFFENLLSSKSCDEWNARCISIIDKYAQDNEKMRIFFTKFSKSLKEHVWSRDDESLNFWTNNNCESVNHVLKNFLDWKVVKVSHLIDSLGKIIKSQYKDILRSFSGEGAFFLSNEMSDFKISKMAWDGLNEKQQNSHLYKAIKTCYSTKNCHQSNSNPPTMITSSDGQFKMPLTQTIAKKIGQRKRIKSNRTPTFTR